MCRHTIFRSYGRYYGCYYYRISNDSSYSTWYNDVVMPCHVQANSFKDDDDNGDDDDTKVRTALPGTKELRAKNDDEHAFLCTRRCRSDNWNLLGACEVLLHRWNLSKLCVSRAAGARGDDSSLGYHASSHGKMRM